jgi:hypothetical protein
MTPLLSRLSLGLLAMMCLAAQAAPGAALAGGMVSSHPIVSALQRAKGELALTAVQLDRWNDAESAGQAAREAMRADHQQLRALFDEEGLTPDIGRLDRQAEALLQAGRLAREAARDKWLALYDSLTPLQQGIASQRIQEALATMDARHGQVGQMSHEPGAAPTGAG